MATLAQASFLLIITLHIHHFFGEAKTLAIINNCIYTVWPGITAYSGTTSANDSGFALLKGESRLVAVQASWRGRVWGRTLCSTDKSTGNFSCQTGDCSTGKIQCTGDPAGSTSDPAGAVTLAEFGFGQSGNDDYYDVSLVDGYNLPVMVAPHVDSGVGCTVTGCVFDLEGSCPSVLTMLGNTPNVSSIIGCRSPCDVFGTDQYCCTAATACEPTKYSLNFKRHCPRAYSYPIDDPTSTFPCDAMRASSYNITFCPSLAMSRLFSVPSYQALQQAPAQAPTPGPSPTTVQPSTTNSTTKHTHLNPSSNGSAICNTSKKKLPASLLVVFPIAAVILIVVLLGICIHKYRRNAMETNYVQTNEMRKFTDSLQFEFNTIRLATRNFAPDNKLGEGGFGEVYKGELEGGQEIAVKRLSKNSVQGIAEFETEIVLVAKLQHKNLVKLLGYCSAPQESLLVYEFLSNSSLDKFLFDSAKKSSLDWQTRLKIIIGIARGMMYLHEDSRIKVVHRDLKSSNILLDEAMNPKIADFGLARLFEVDQTQGDTKRIVGTYGYMAPEYAITGHYSVKSDVYSFGVIVLEIISGQRNRLFGQLQLDEALIHRAWRLWNEDEALSLIDTELGDNIEREDVLKCIHIGLLCIQENATDRPRMTSIVAVLNGQDISLPTPKVPHFFGCGGDEAQDVVDGSLVPHVYTEIETITDVYSRD